MRRDGGGTLPFSNQTRRNPGPDTGMVDAVFDIQSLCFGDAYYRRSMSNAISFTLSRPRQPVSRTSHSILVRTAGCTDPGTQSLSRQRIYRSRDSVPVQTTSPQIQSLCLDPDSLLGRDRVTGSADCHYVPAKTAYLQIQTLFPVPGSLYPDTDTLPVQSVGPDPVTMSRPRPPISRSRHSAPVQTAHL